MRRLQAPAGHEPGIDQHQHRAFCPAISETSTYVQMCAAAQPLCGRVETVWVQPQSFDDGRQPESRSSQLTGGTGWSIWTSDLQTPQQCLVHWVEYRHSYTGETIRTTLRGVPQLAFCLAVALKPGCFRQFLAKTYTAS